ncbi:hypothetical protein ACHAO1_007407 [Botrytis cinerea]
MANSGGVLPNNESMDQRPVRPLEAIINDASKRYMFKMSQSFSQTAGAPGPSQGPPIASSVDQPRTGLDSSQGGSVLRIDVMPVPGKGFSGNRAFIKSIWDRTAANGQISGARTFTFTFDPSTPPFVPFNGSLYGRLEEEDFNDYDCGFSHCGGFCALYAPCAANGDNNGAIQQASSSAVQNEGEANIVPNKDNVEVEAIVKNEDNVQVEAIVTNEDNVEVEAIVKNEDNVQVEAIVTNEDNVQVGDIVPDGGNASDTEDDSEDDEEGGAPLDAWERPPLTAEQLLKLDEEMRTEMAEIKRRWILSGRRLDHAYPHRMGCECFFCTLDG